MSGKSVLPVHDNLRQFSTIIAVFQNIITFAREMLGVVLTEISAHKWCAFDPVRTSVCTWSDRLVWNTDPWKEYYGF